jgi:uncharacterized membrane protein
MCKVIVLLCLVGLTVITVTVSVVIGFALTVFAVLFALAAETLGRAFAAVIATAQTLKAVMRSRAAIENVSNAFIFRCVVNVGASVIIRPVKRRHQSTT